MLSDKQILSDKIKTKFITELSYDRTCKNIFIFKPPTQLIRRNTLNMLMSVSAMVQCGIKIAFKSKLYYSRCGEFIRLSGEV